MTRDTALLWAWRLAVVAALLWIGVTLRQIARQMPSDYSHETQQKLEDIRRDAGAIRETLGARRAPTPGIDAFIEALPGHPRK